MASTVFNLDVNNFPSLTWHHLHINHGHMEASLSSAADASVRGTGGGIAFAKVLEGASSLNPKASSIETQMGKEFDKTFDSFAKEKNLPLNLFTVNAGSQNQSPVNVSFDIADCSQTAADFFIDAGEDSSSVFIFDFSSKKASEGVFGTRIRVLASPYAKVHIVTVNMLSSGFVNFTALGTCNADGAEVEVTQLELGGGKVFSGSMQLLEGYQSKAFGQEGYFAKKSAEFDINYIVRHTGRDTSSEVVAEGVVSDSAQKSWRGTIDFVNGCRGAKGNESEAVLLLNENVTNKSLPVILCDEEDVEGQHGCSIGKLGKDVMFYLKNRGLDEKAVRNLMIRAKIFSVCRHIPDEELNGRIKDFIEGDL